MNTYKKSFLAYSVRRDVDTSGKVIPVLRTRTAASSPPTSSSFQLLIPPLLLVYTPPTLQNTNQALFLSCLVWNKPIRSASQRTPTLRVTVTTDRCTRLPAQVSTAASGMAWLYL